MAWIVYILRCSDRTLYTGITNDLDKRLAAHTAGKGARYTRGRGPFRVLFVEELGTKGDALRREAQIKRLKRAEKLKLARRGQRLSSNPDPARRQRGAPSSKER